ncbi:MULTISPECIES: ABC transporter ATP-binding protein [Microbacterium]|uniref:ABC transporter ATP-binding protein n=1 Tax=Microbacterium TaxID=33882 RepID=UPI00217D7999|nr:MULTISPECIES: ABC transporter ATP-binding protein [Microbacterium]UWF78391.1 ABC transporter ATP-binding protein [Microbacterium neungamense]WCM56567.1 ABC transporter ATP-binding protein [Microbacterium sp. EF45047]
MTLQLSDVGKSFGAARVLTGVGFDVPTGSRMALVGASGSGKSTLLRLIAGFERPDAGRIALDGVVLADERTLVPAHRRGIGYVPQDGALFPHLTVARNIAFGLPRGAARRERVREMMALTSLAPEFADRMPHELSGGQQQRVALARALAPAPRVLLLDEPFSALDTGLRAQTREATIGILERARVTTLLVTHDQDEALSFGDLIGVVADGALVQHGEPASVFDAPADAATAAFLGDALQLRARRGDDGAVRCALGTVPVRHDRAAGAAEVVAMVRPNQLEIVAEDGCGGRATITARRAVGARTELRLDIEGDESARVWLQVPTHRAQGTRDGDVVGLRIDGGVVLYPAARLSIPDPTERTERQPA